jgi:transcriptional regulator with XRE-family HTH domain
LSGLPTPEGTDVNAALRKALAEAQLTETDVAAHLGVDPKTVRRWLSGQRPYPRHRWALTKLLQTEENTLWPQGSQKDESQPPASKHVQFVYEHRWQVPREKWWNLFESAEEEICILVYSGLFLADDAGMLELLAARARTGVNVRILLGNPGSQVLIERGNEERVGKSISGRASNSMLLFRSLVGIAGVEIKTHSTVLYSSIYMTEKKIFANPHLYGIPAAKAPLIDVDRRLSPDLANMYWRSFETAWQASKSGQ